MLKTIGSSDKPAPSKNNSSRSASSRKNNSRPASKKNNGDNEIDRFGVGGNDMKYAKKSGKSKSEKTSKSQNLAKSGKKLSKSGNLTNFDATKVGPKFLTPNTRIAFNYL